MVPTGPSDETLILDTLRAWADGYTRLDAAAIKRVFPSIREPDLKSAFSQLKSQAMQLTPIQVDISGSIATVSCSVSASVDLLVGGRKRDSYRSIFSLQKINGSWLIVRVSRQ